MRKKSLRYEINHHYPSLGYEGYDIFTGISTGGTESWVGHHGDDSSPLMTDDG